MCKGMLIVPAFNGGTPVHASNQHADARTLPTARDT